MIRTIAAACLLPLLLTAQTGKLPVKRVVLFKNGVGYFEHAGTVHGNESVTVSFTSGQLNDVLKSLTVLDLGGGRIAGVAYGSTAPLDRQLGDLRLQIGEKATLAQVLDSLRGAHVEIKSGGAGISGRLLSAERKMRTISTVSQEIDYVSLITENGELRSMELSPASSVRLLDQGLTSRLDRYLNLASAERDADVRNMVISAEGTGDRRLSVSYISEVPVWKSTYRLVLGSKGESGALLQGWAIVDNVGEDWNNVELSLVAGAPQSFIQNLSQPYYAQRPTIGLPDTMSTTPQTYESTLIPGSAQLSGVVTDPAGTGVSGANIKALNAAGVLVAQTTANATGAYEFETLPEGAIRLQVEAAGFRTTEINDLTSRSGKPIQQNVTLAVGSVAQSVEVTAGAASGRVGGGRALGKGTSLGGRSPGVGYGSGSGGGSGGGVYRVAAPRFDAAAQSQALGDLFEYKLKDPITILKNRSALVPIAQASITAEKVSIWNDRNSVPRPQRAVWITNSTRLTLDGGA